MTTRIAIIGAGGQVGSRLLKHLSEDPRFVVWGVCRNEITAAPLRMDGLDVRVGSIVDKPQELAGNADVVLNCAAASGMPLSARVENERVLAALCILSGKRRLVHFSSVAVYGWCINARHSTFERPRPNWVYGDDKLHLEHFFAARLQSTPHQAVVLRMGHVYGAGQWLSKSAFTMAADPDRRLAFDGALSSNAIHVRNVAAAVAALVSDWKPGTYNLLNAPASTWREVFDWHTAALGIPPVPGLDEAQSRAAAEYHLSRAAISPWAKLKSEGMAWFRSLPSAFANACPSSKQILLSQVTRWRASAMERRLLLEYTRTSAGSASTGPAVSEPWLLSDGIPGPQLEYRPAVSEQDVRELLLWYRRYASPDAIRDWDTLDAEPVAQ